MHRRSRRRGNEKRWDTRKASLQVSEEGEEEETTTSVSGGMCARSICVSPWRECFYSSFLFLSNHRARDSPSSFSLSVFSFLKGPRKKEAPGLSPQTDNAFHVPDASASLYLSVLFIYLSLAVYQSIYLSFHLSRPVYVSLSIARCLLPSVLFSGGAPGRVEGGLSLCGSLDGLYVRNEEDRSFELGKTAGDSSIYLSTVCPALPPMEPPALYMSSEGTGASSSSSSAYAPSISLPFGVLWPRGGAR